MTEICRERQLARPKAPPKPQKPKRAGDSKAYLAMIRQLPCAATRIDGGCEAHHCQHLIRHGLAQKVEDRYCIPLTTSSHYTLHSAGSHNHKMLLASWGVDAAALTDALWRIWCDRDRDKLERMRSIVLKHEVRT